MPTLSTPGSSRAITTGVADGLSYIVVNHADNNQLLTLSLTPSGGSFRGLSDTDPNTGGIQLRGTASEINAALATGTFVAHTDGSASISASLSDGLISTPVVTTYSLNATNAAPTLNQVNTLNGAKEDQIVPISFLDLFNASNAADPGGGVIGFVVTSIDSSKGSLSIGGSAWDATTNNQIDTDHPAVWTPATDLNGTDSNAIAAFSIQAVDSGGLTSSTPKAVRVNVTPANDAPSLILGSHSFTGITEDTATAGVNVSTILASRAADVDSTDLGIAVKTATGLGTWQYSTNNGTSWTNFGPISDNSALLLGSTTQVRYQADGISGESGNNAPTLTFHAWDGTEGSIGDKVPTSLVGAASSLSTDTNTATVNVSDVDDPLTLTLARPTSIKNNVTAADFTYQEVDLDALNGNDLTLLDAGLTLSDPDTALSRSAMKLLINSGLVAAEDRLELQGGVNARVFRCEWRYDSHQHPQLHGWRDQ